MIMPELMKLAILVFAYMTLVFVIALVKKDNSVVDIFWGPGFIAIAMFSLFRGATAGPHKMAVNILVILWGVRLAMHIFTRNRGKGEDFRYKQWRDTWHHFILRSFFQIFMLQGIFLLIIAMPVYYVNYLDNIGFRVTDWIGIALFATGFLFESVGDIQLFQFRRNPANKGKIITRGLWKITRHPNYFGEALIWWGFGFFALGLPYGWKTLISPVLITFMLRFVSGVPMLEKKYEGRPDWEEYKKKTAPFVPFVNFL
jgi:steroid 5-alpha reductase family enzyme